MRGVEVEIIPRPKKIHQKELHTNEAELLLISLQLDTEHFLGHPIRSIGLFRVAVPKVGFPKGRGSEFGIGTDGSNDNGLFNASLSALLNQMDSHRQILVEKGAGKPKIGANAAADRGQVNDKVGTRLSEEA